MKKGTSCSGNLAPLGSGSSGSPITIDGYGSGAAPIINGGGSATAAVQLTNQQYWVIQNLEVTNSNPSAGNRIGIRVLNTAGGTLNYIRVLNNYVHNVDGGGSGHGTGGIIINAGSTSGDKFNDVVIQGNSVADVARDGILVIDQNWVAAGQAITNVSITQKILYRPT